MYSLDLHQMLQIHYCLHLNIVIKRLLSYYHRHNSMMIQHCHLMQYPTKHFPVCQVWMSLVHRTKLDKQRHQYNQILEKTIDMDCNCILKLLFMHIFYQIKRKKKHTKIGCCSCNFISIRSFFICSSNKTKINNTFFRMYKSTCIRCWC